MDVYSFAGYSAAFLESISLIPQLSYYYKTGKTEGMTYTFIFIHLINHFLCMIYAIGVAINTDIIFALPLLIPPPIAIFFGVILLVFKVQDDMYHEDQKKTLVTF